ncbi:MAG TPA: GNAT family N-acetyltransferase [Acidimicrobiales bacterium]
MPESSSPVEVVDNPDKHRYEARVGGDLAGFVTYRARPGAVTLVHTEVDQAFEGHGVGGQLAAATLADIGGRGLKVEPLCPFIARYLQRHPELSGLVVGSKP